MAESAGKPQASKSKTEKAKVEKNRAEKSDIVAELAFRLSIICTQHLQLLTLPYKTVSKNTCQNR